MDDATRARLNAINRRFYQVTADSFDETRNHAWPGWERLLTHLRLPLRVLDIGCGNGRFGVFLAEHLQPSSTALLHYHGIDSSPALLTHADRALAHHASPGSIYSLEERDIVESPPDDGLYDLVVLFGVMHHIPGASERQELVKSLAARVAPGGILGIACWRFYEYPRFRDRVVPWPDDITVEAGDMLLDWRRGEHALRYCHYVDDAEQAALVAASGLTEIASYRADGNTNDINCYSLLKNE